MQKSGQRHAGGRRKGAKPRLRRQNHQPRVLLLLLVRLAQVQAASRRVGRAVGARQQPRRRRRRVAGKARLQLQRAARSGALLAPHQAVGAVVLRLCRNGCVAASAGLLRAALGLIGMGMQQQQLVMLAVLTAGHQAVMKGSMGVLLGLVERAAGMQQQQQHRRATAQQQQRLGAPGASRLLLLVLLVAGAVVVVVVRRPACRSSQQSGTGGLLRTCLRGAPSASGRCGSLCRIWKAVIRRR